MDMLERLAVPHSNELYREIYLRRSWNSSMERGFRQCSTAAKQWINTMTVRNHKAVDELKELLGDKFA